MKRFFNWLANLFSKQAAPTRPALTRSGSLRVSGRHIKAGSGAPRQAVPERQPEFVNLDPELDGKVVESLPGRNVLIRSKFVREDSGTHDTLTLLDDSLTESVDEVGTDPYDTGDFDRSKNWDRRFRNS